MTDNYSNSRFVLVTPHLAEVTPAQLEVDIVYATGIAVRAEGEEMGVPLINLSGLYIPAHDAPSYIASVIAAAFSGSAEIDDKTLADAGGRWTDEQLLSSNARETNLEFWVRVFDERIDRALFPEIESWALPEVTGQYQPKAPGERVPFAVPRTLPSTS